MSNQAKQALILFAHGARDPRWAEPFRKLAERVQAQRPDIIVALAFLELMSPRLPDCVPQLVGQGCEKISVVPVFLGQGGHVLRDLPLLLDDLRRAYPELQLDVAQAVGEDESVQEAMARYCVATLSA
ncbi:sirohydrochlorin chelatase [Lacisediminimonas sp.]|uniref:sirohydrochlorin chelatase n=1 Tax=Lacisediminimonas sp. TaxID=3060582 RepID=UPI0027176AFA|nr:CbiX/SirB N-terminal domain-containing protein [Lacisediminimonas sp.]MDO8298299.1 CbiX/SirB N-terminal domain-containing protein [Lacisediminimonas sp.]MDO9216879.1 CbiX/SirB N-terminal domain-containing protein [Lacisediminimonas sp.]